MKVAAEALQASWYSRTAHLYDAEHVDPDDEHGVALKYAYGLMHTIDIRTVLDVGCGTGRAVQFFSNKRFSVLGVEPVLPMLERAANGNGISRDVLIAGRGDNLPFPDRSFDCVCEFGMLHHVSDPKAVVAEMTRVARQLVLISDSNRFGHGRPAARLLKLMLYKAGLWDLARYAMTRGKGYAVSPGDGLAYSYSVYDSLAQLGAWATRIVLVPTMPSHQRTWLQPLLTSPHLLLCAIRD